MFKSPLSISAECKCSVVCCDKKQCQDLHIQSLKVLKNQIQAGLFLQQVYVPKKAAQIKVMQIKTKFPFKQWWLGDWQPHPIRGLLEKYSTFGREKETGLPGALDT